jgi:hypothetical protein
VDKAPPPPIQQQPNAAVCSGARFNCYSRIRVNNAGQPDTTVLGYTPGLLAQAYHLDTSRSPNATIAIVDAYGYPNAESDLAAYRANYGLSACTVASGCLTIVNQNGQTTPLPAAPPSGDDWTIETALDLDMASAACPNCKLLLVQANDDQSDGLFIANDTAATLGATVVSNSWGEPESDGIAAEETHFNHPGIGYFVASGDYGWNMGGNGPSYPSTSVHVTAVGGTSLIQADSPRGWTEFAWSSSGSSCSNNIAAPSWQQTTACTMRATADVSAVADPNTPPLIYNSANGGYLAVGGTSAASPFVAGVYALYGLGAAAPGWAESKASSFYDVISGTNGLCGTVLCDVRNGWDGPTGVGTPNGDVLGGVCTPACSDTNCGADDGCGGTCAACSGSDGSGSGTGSGSTGCPLPATIATVSWSNSQAEYTAGSDGSADTVLFAGDDMTTIQSGTDWWFEVFVLAGAGTATPDFPTLAPPAGAVGVLTSDSEVVLYTADLSSVYLATTGSLSVSQLGADGATFGGTVSAVFTHYNYDATNGFTGPAADGCTTTITSTVFSASEVAQ